MGMKITGIAEKNTNHITQRRLTFLLYKKKNAVYCTQKLALVFTD